MEGEPASVPLPHPPPSHGLSATGSSRAVPHSPAFELLSSEEAVILGLDEEGRKRLAPILHLPCQRTASTGRRLDRELVLTASGMILLLRPSPGVPRIANISHRILLCAGRHDCRFFTCEDSTAGGRTLRTQLVVSTFEVEAHHPLAGTVAVVPTGVVELWFSTGPESDRLLSLLQSFSRRCSGLSVRPCDSLYQGQRGNVSRSLRSTFRSAWSFFQRPTGAAAPSAHQPLASNRDAELSPVPSGCVDRAAAALTVTTTTDSDAYRPSKLLLESLPRNESVPLSLLQSRKPLPEEQRRRIREQLNAWFRKFAPDEAFLVDDVLQKYKGVEDWLECKILQRLPVLEQLERSDCDPVEEVELEGLDRSAERPIDDGDGGSDPVEVLNNILFDISVLERACDRIAWMRGGTSTGAATTKTFRNGMEQPLEGPRGQKQTRNLYETKRKETQALATLVLGICARRTKEALHNEEERLHQSFVELLKQSHHRPT